MIYEGNFPTSKRNSINLKKFRITWEFSKLNTFPISKESHDDIADRGKGSSVG